MKFHLDVSSIIVLCVVLAFLVWAWRMIRGRLEEQRYYEDAAALEFESSVRGLTAGVASELPVQAVEPQKPAPLPLNDSETLPLSSRGISGDEPVATTENTRLVIERLNRAGVLQGVEGYREHYGNPHGIAYLKLKSGETALLVGEMESAAFLAANERRADMIIIATSDKNVYVVRPFSKLLADNISL